MAMMRLPFRPIIAACELENRRMTQNDPNHDNRDNDRSTPHRKMMLFETADAQSRASNTRAFAINARRSTFSKERNPSGRSSSAITDR